MTPTETQTAPVARQDGAPSVFGGALDHPRIPAAVKLGAERAAGESEGVLAVLFLPFDPAASSANRTRGRHWGERGEDEETAQTAAAWAHRIAGDPVLAEPVTVDILCFRVREMDDDGITSGLKAARDWLFGRRPGKRALGVAGRPGRMVTDDRPEFMAWGSVSQATARCFAGSAAWTVLIVRRRVAGHQQRAAGKAGC